MKQPKLTFLRSSKRKTENECYKSEPASKKQKKEREKMTKSDIRKKELKKPQVKDLPQDEKDSSKENVRFSNSMKDVVKTKCQICRCSSTRSLMISYYLISCISVNQFP